MLVEIITVIIMLITIKTSETIIIMVVKTCTFSITSDLRDVSANDQFVPTTGTYAIYLVIPLYSYSPVPDLPSTICFSSSTNDFNPLSFIMLSKSLSIFKTSVLFE